jgi:hypothetical protein
MGNSLRAGTIFTLLAWRTVQLGTAFLQNVIKILPIYL